jgi:hypothetical protein
MAGKSRISHHHGGDALDQQSGLVRERRRIGETGPGDEAPDPVQRYCLVTVVGTRASRNDEGN